MLYLTQLKMAKITPSLSTRKDGRGKSEILLRFVAGRDHIYRLHSNIYINPARWKDGAVVIPRLATSEQAELKAVKSRLDALCDYLIERFVEADKSLVNRDYMQRMVDTFYHPRATGADGELSDLLQKYIQSKDVSDWRMKRYRVVCAAIRRFEAVRGKPLQLSDVNGQLLLELDHFLVNEHEIARRPEYRRVYGRMRAKELPKPRSRNTLLDYTNILRAFFVWARASGYTDNDPFVGIVSGTAHYGTPYYITIEERNRIYRTDLSRHPSLAAQRDIFVFQCLVGCRVGDLVRLTKADVVDGVLVYIPHKTVTTHPQTLRIPLTPTAQEIVDRYADLPGQKLLPFISPQKYNDAIKRIFLAARVRRMVAVLDPLTRKEVKKPLNEVASSHLARRAFVGNLYRKVKDRDSVSSMSGHGNKSAAFDRYRDIDDDFKTEIVNLLEE